MTERGYMYEKDGALWLKATAYGDDKDRVVIRDNGVPTYLAADIAYHWNNSAAALTVSSTCGALITMGISPE